MPAVATPRPTTSRREVSSAPSAPHFLGNASAPPALQLSSTAETPAAPDLAPAAVRGHRTSPRSDLRASVGDAAGYSVMVGIGETYFAPFALALGTGETFAGLVATLPMLSGALLQLATPWGVRKFGSLKRWIVTCASVQAVALLLMPLAAMIYSTTAAALWVFAAATLYWAAGLATAPAWNTWIEGLVPKTVRTRYFACRSRISQVCTLLGFVAGGIALQVGSNHSWLLPAFAGIFLIAATCRAFSATCLANHSDVGRSQISPRHFSIRELLAHTRSQSSGRLVIYLLLVQTAVQISGPYFTPFMLSEEKLSYFNFMILMGISFAGKVLALTFWGKIARAYGARRLLVIGGLAIVPISSFWVASDWISTSSIPFSVELGGTSMLWELSPRLGYLMFVQLLSGVAWAAYELAMMLMFFEAIPRTERMYMLTLYNFGNAVAMMCGAIIGAIVLQLGGENHAAFLMLFGISSLVRLATVPFLALMPNVKTEILQPAIRVIAVRPDGAIDRPIVSSMSDTHRASDTKLS